MFDFFVFVVFSMSVLYSLNVKRGFFEPKTKRFVVFELSKDDFFVRNFNYLDFIREELGIVKLKEGQAIPKEIQTYEVSSKLWFCYYCLSYWLIFPMTLVYKAYTENNLFFSFINSVAFCFLAAILIDRIDND